MVGEVRNKTKLYPSSVELEYFMGTESLFVCFAIFILFTIVCYAMPHLSDLLE